MKYYLIFKSDELVGYCHNKKILNEFLSSRKPKYTFKKVKNIPEDVLDILDRNGMSLEYYTGYCGRYENPLFNWEITSMEESLSDQVVDVCMAIDFIVRHLVYMQLTQDEQELIISVLLDIQELISGEYDSTEFVIDERFDISAYINLILD